MQSKLLAIASAGVLMIAGTAAWARHTASCFGHDLIGFCNEAIELLLVPDKVRALHRAGIAVVRERAGFPSDDIVEIRDPL
jgi:hypothetical protein